MLVPSQGVVQPRPVASPLSEGALRALAARSPSSIVRMRCVLDAAEEQWRPNQGHLLLQRRHRLIPSREFHDPSRQIWPSPSSGEVFQSCLVHTQHNQILKDPSEKPLISSFFFSPLAAANTCPANYSFCCVKAVDSRMFAFFSLPLPRKMAPAIKAKANGT